MMVTQDQRETRVTVVSPVVLDLREKRDQWVCQVSLDILDHQVKRGQEVKLDVKVNLERRVLLDHAELWVPEGLQVQWELEVNGETPDHRDLQVLRVIRVLPDQLENQVHKVHQDLRASPVSRVPWDHRDPQEMTVCPELWVKEELLVCLESQDNQDQWV